MASHFKFDRKSTETETTTRSEFPNGGKAILEQILVSKEINKSKRSVRVAVRDPRKINHLRKVIEIEKLYQSSPGLSVPPE